MNKARNLLQELLVAIERLQARVNELESRGREAIAIVGASCRFPGADNPQALWELARDRRDMVRDVPASRWDGDRYFDPRPEQPGKMISRRAGFLDGLDQFDPQFFGISSREAVALDPQHRLLLETVQEAIENAGIPTDRLVRSRTGVFVGISVTEYQQMMLGGALETVDIYAANGGALNTAAGRISFVFGFEGPTLAVDTACSSSLVAVHLAVQSLRRGEVDLALASGVNVVLRPTGMVLFSQWGLMAPDGTCKAFDDAANGFVRAEGCGTIALKRLSDALAADDPILAVVRGTAVNSDGRSSGLTAPHGPSQEAVIRAALKDAGLTPGDIDYIEAHGTGTALGDPIEIEAIGAVMREGHGLTNPLVVGAIKPNIGHGEASAGMAGLLKIVASLRNEAIPPNIHFATPNRRVDWDALPVRVPKELVPWPRQASRGRRAGVSAFGFSGTNAHVVIEEAPLRSAAAPAPDTPRLALLSARTPSALQMLASRQEAFVADNPDVSLADVLETLATGRAHLQRRLAFPVRTVADLREGLAATAAGRLPAKGAEGSVRVGEGPRVAFLFTGQGSQYAGMGYELYERELVFKEAIDRCADILAGRLDIDLRTLLFTDGPSAPDLSRTGYTQPALFAFEYALAQLWQSWGVRPALVVGHSVGEYVAACVAGVFSLEDALQLIAERGRLMQALPTGGAMAAVFASEPEVDAVLANLNGRAVKAAVNGPEEIAISGEAAAVASAVEQLRSVGFDARQLDVSHAFHSPMLDPMLDALERAAAQVPHVPPRIALVSNLTGNPFATGQAPGAAYWRRHAREAVRFADCLASIGKSGIGALLEIGPRPVLLGMAERVLPTRRWLKVASLKQGRDAQESILEALRDLHVGGVVIDWGSVDRRRGGHRIALPPQPFQRERYWADAPANVVDHIADSAHPLLGSRHELANSPGTYLWERELSLTTHPWIADNRVEGAAIVPVTAYIEMAFAASREVMSSGSLAIRNLENRKPIILHEGQKRLLQVTLSVGRDGTAEFKVHSRPADFGNCTECRMGLACYCKHCRRSAAPRTTRIAGNRRRARQMSHRTRWHFILRIPCQARQSVGTVIPGRTEALAGPRRSCRTDRNPGSASGRDGPLSIPSGGVRCLRPSSRCNHRARKANWRICWRRCRRGDITQRGCHISYLDLREDKGWRRQRSDPDR